MIFLTLMGFEDVRSFGHKTLERRMIHGGLPPFFLAETFPEKDFQEWLDSFWAKDIEELFKVDKKGAFLKFFELLALQSGGMFEAKSFAAPCAVSHTTIASYLNVMAQTHIAYVLRTYHKNAAKEIVAAPKVYFFDTGFITYFRGSNEIGPNEKDSYRHRMQMERMRGGGTSVPEIPRAPPRWA